MLDLMQLRLLGYTSIAYSLIFQVCLNLLRFSHSTIIAASCKIKVSLTVHALYRHRAEGT